ncbi:MAG: hypothetical protein ACOYKZ_06180 [Chlamydiia bacterium]
MFVGQLGTAAYQDIFVNGEVVKSGTQICDQRYQLIRPILDRYQRKFSVLDLGALEGYFSWRIATDYNSVVTMIEGGEPGKGIYPYAKDGLFEMCGLNSHLKNVTYLSHWCTSESLAELGRREHFDVVLALLSVHLIASCPKTGRVETDVFHEILDRVLALGNEVIVEMAVDCYTSLDGLVAVECKKRGGTFMGGIARYKEDRKSWAHFYHFGSPSHLSGRDASPISESTFRDFGGVWPAG